MLAGAVTSTTAMVFMSHSAIAAANARKAASMRSGSISTSRNHSTPRMSPRTFVGGRLRCAATLHHFAPPTMDVQRQARASTRNKRLHRRPGPRVPPPVRPRAHAHRWTPPRRTVPRHFPVVPIPPFRTAGRRRAGAPPFSRPHAFVAGGSPGRSYASHRHDRCHPRLRRRPSDARWRRTTGTRLGPRLRVSRSCATPASTPSGSSCSPMRGEVWFRAVLTVRFPHWRPTATAVSKATVTSSSDTESPSQLNPRGLRPVNPQIAP